MSSIGQDITHATALLQSGEIVAIPTETVYGLAANALHPAAIVKIFEAKNRPRFNPLIAHVADWQQAQRLVTHFPPAAQQLANVFWPGPLTLLLPKAAQVPDLLTAGSPQVAIRVPDHELTRELLTRLDFPLAAPSANPSGYISPTQAAHVAEQLGDKVPYILDGGSTRVGIESTIVGFDAQGKPWIYRLGGLAIEEIEAVVGKTDFMPKIQDMPDSPGQLKSHYAPQTPLVLGALQAEDFQGKTIGALRFTEALSNIPISQQIVLSQSGNFAEAAQKLFDAMRELDARGYDLIVAERLPDRQLGRAINDRLERAQHKFKK